VAGDESSVKKIASSKAAKAERRKARYESETSAAKKVINDMAKNSEAGN